MYTDRRSVTGPNQNGTQFEPIGPDRCHLCQRRVGRVARAPDIDRGTQFARRGGEVAVARGDDLVGHRCDHVGSVRAESYTPQRSSPTRRRRHIATLDSPIHSILRHHRRSSLSFITTFTGRVHWGPRQRAFTKATIAARTSASAVRNASLAARPRHRARGSPLRGSGPAVVEQEPRAVHLVDQPDAPQRWRAPLGPRRREVRAVRPPGPRPCRGAAGRCTGGSSGRPVRGCRRRRRSCASACDTTRTRTRSNDSAPSPHVGVVGAAAWPGRRGAGVEGHAAEAVVGDLGVATVGRRGARVWAGGAVSRRDAATT